MAKCCLCGINICILNVNGLICFILSCLVQKKVHKYYKFLIFNKEKRKLFFMN